MRKRYRFCPTCRDAFGGRIHALRLQADYQIPITEVIIQAGRCAFDWNTEADGRNVLGRFGGNLGVSRHTVADWLDFFFGLSWPDWKRKYVCAAHSCSILDVSRVTLRGRHTRLAKFYPVNQFRQRGICSCPIADGYGSKKAKVDLVLVDLRPNELTAEKLKDRFVTGPKWTRQIEVVTGSHLPLLDGQIEDQENS